MKIPVSVFTLIVLTLLVAPVLAVYPNEQVAAGGSHVLIVLGNDTVMAHGSNEHGQCSVPAGLRNVRAVSAGMFHSLALLGNGRVVGWGANFRGQCTISQTLSGVVSIAAGGDRSLALLHDGTVVAWGESTGICRTVVAWGHDLDRSLEVPRNLDPVTAISAGEFHSLALRANGTVVVGQQYQRPMRYTGRT